MKCGSSALSISADSYQFSSEVLLSVQRKRCAFFRCNSQQIIQRQQQGAPQGEHYGLLCRCEYALQVMGGGRWAV
jgi:hypothetical protein